MVKMHAEKKELKNYSLVNFDAEYFIYAANLSLIFKCINELCIFKSIKFKT